MLTHCVVAVLALPVSSYLNWDCVNLDDIKFLPLTAACQADSAFDKFTRVVYMLQINQSSRTVLPAR